MVKTLLFGLILLSVSHTAFSQGLLRDTSINIPAFQFGYSGNLTAFDAREKTDYLHVLSPGISFKTSSNWIIEGELDLLMGQQLNEDQTAYLIYSELGLPINIEGRIEEVTPRFQGYQIHFSFLKLLKATSYNYNTGWVAGAGIGFMRHRIKFAYPGTTVPQLEDPYVKGYDRLTYGTMLSQYIGYRLYSNRNLFNYSIGFEVVQGLTKNRRSWNYDLMGPDNSRRLDMYYGLKFTFIIPAYGVK